MNRNKTGMLILSLLAILILAGGLWAAFRTPKSPTIPYVIPENNIDEDSTSSTPNEEGSGDSEEVNGITNLIEIDAPQANAQISSPVTVSGKARGPWYFEASFPVQILDANGKQLGQAPVQAKGEWMTEEFVPFEGKVTFSKPTTQTGFVVFHKDNPSGLPESEQEIRVPVRF